VSRAAHLTVPAEAAHLPSLTRSLQEFWTAAGLPMTQAHAFELALEEVFMNVVMHAASGAGTVLRVELALALAEGGVIMTVEDDGPQFDPLSLPPPDVISGVTERRIGGYGVYLVRQMMDVVSYQRIGTRNQLRMSKHIAR
jgi:serine/threonine-protein kinase RsbW